MNDNRAAKTEALQNPQGYQPTVALRIANPCSQSWEAMTGDARERHCETCQRNVVNTAAMTPRQLEALLVKPGPLPCMRLVQLEDGSLLLAKEQVRLSRLQRAGMALSTLMLSAAGAFAQAAQQAELSGRVIDPTGAQIPGTTMSLLSGDTVVATVKTDASGEFSLSAPEGQYSLIAEAFGFARRKLDSVVLHSGAQEIEGGTLRLAIGNIGVVIVDAGSSQIPTEEPSLTTLLAEDDLKTVPVGAKASLSGTVVDPQRIPIPNAELHFTSPDGHHYLVRSNDRGEFTAGFLATGRYEMTAAVSGFALSSQYVQIHNGGQQLKKPLPLAIGNAVMGRSVTAELPTRKAKLNPAVAPEEQKQPAASDPREQIQRNELLGYAMPVLHPTESSTPKPR